MVDWLAGGLAESKVYHELHRIYRIWLKKRTNSKKLKNKNTEIWLGSGGKLLQS